MRSRWMWEPSSASSRSASMTRETCFGRPTHTPTPEISRERLARGRVLNVDPAIGDVRRRRSLSCESDAEQHAEQNEAHKVLEDGRGTLHPRGSFSVRRTQCILNCAI